MEFRFGRIEGLEQRQGDSALHPDQPSPRLLDWNSGIKTQFLLGSALQEGWGLERKCMQIEVHSCSGMVGVGGRGGGGSGGGGGGGGGGLLENANPLIYERSVERPVTAGEEDEQVADSIDAREIFDLIRSINDPEHPLTLEELNVVEQVRVQVSDPDSTVAVAFTPTIPHCSMATLIGLSIKVKLLRSLPQRFK
ncbi:cytosolic iron-sulfur assembly component 2B isoform X3 [Fukomys damarensis]|nr:cytosolic iron-sulfur assembly component 2B isoform X3 [Fukomys damarensis]